jgi:hypothetical protein
VTSFGFPLIPVVDGSILLIDSLWEGACGAVVWGLNLGVICLDLLICMGLPINESISPCAQVSIR